MPFDKETAAKAGSKGGKNRWTKKDPNTVRNKQLKIEITQAEYTAIIEKAAAVGLSNAELIVRAVKSYKGKKGTLRYEKVVKF